MLKILRCFFVVAVIASAALAMSSSARAELSIAVVDIQRLQSQSEAAQSIQKQLEERRDALQNEFAGYEQELRDNEKKLVEGRENITPEEFAAHRKEFEGKLLETRQLVQKRRRDLEIAVAQASKILNDEIFKIVAEETEKEGYQLVLTRQNVVLVEKSIDITERVLTALNEKIKTIKLEK